MVVSAGNAKINKIAHTPPSRTILFSLGVYSVWLPGLSRCCYFPSAGMCCSAGRVLFCFLFFTVCLPSPSPPFSTFLSLKMRQSFLSVRPHRVKSLTLQFSVASHLLMFSFLLLWTIRKLCHYLNLVIIWTVSFPASYNSLFWLQFSILSPLFFPLIETLANSLVTHSFDWTAYVFQNHCRWWLQPWN